MALDKQAFYSQYAQVAIEQQKRYGIPASITLAQMGLESGFGTSTPARRSNNFFGVKVGSSWAGYTTITAMTVQTRSSADTTM